MTTPVTELCVPLVSARRSCSIPYFLRLRPPSNGYAAPDVYRVMASLTTPVSVVTILPTRNPPPLPSAVHLPALHAAFFVAASTPVTKGPTL
ncbi:hypothetical protein CCHR01_18884 [Colletotrichum chrysophilum]|uniref:Uncharacterized protein n=1 Tax=Colletotrichum chrysophilum TaxID=1836956 RepID=A0AAD8ZZW9_9PEZI|nr:hypothetical protein CCHR01_18884 [Colletotrichum chrysophilum]